MWYLFVFGSNTRKGDYTQKLNELGVHFIHVMDANKTIFKQIEYQGGHKKHTLYLSFCVSLSHRNSLNTKAGTTTTYIIESFQKSVYIYICVRAHWNNHNQVLKTFMNYSEDGWVMSKCMSFISTDYGFGYIFSCSKQRFLVISILGTKLLSSCTIFV